MKQRSNISCGSGEIASVTTGGEFGSNRVKFSTEVQHVFVCRAQRQLRIYAYACSIAFKVIQMSYQPICAIPC